MRGLRLGGHVWICRARMGTLGRLMRDPPSLLGSRAPGLTPCLCLSPQTFTVPWRWIPLATLSAKPKPGCSGTQRSPSGMR